MPVLVACTCGAEYELRDEFGGKLVKCPKCGAVQRAGGGAIPATSRAPDAPARPALMTPSMSAPAQPFKAPTSADSVFDRDVFLLRQKALTINEKYNVSDQHGNTLLFVERPAHLVRNLFAFVIAMTSFFVVLNLGRLISLFVKDQTVVAIAALFMVFVAIGSFLLVFAALSKKRHITFYRDPGKTGRVMEVRQDSKYQYMVQTYTLRNATGAVLARYTKNHLYNLFRKRWVVEGPGGKSIMVAKEDSIILSLARRYMGPLFGFLRTNFVFFGTSGSVLGEFKRKFTILDRYVLDLQADRDRRLDRRIALALGVLLDTGERR